jgi:hypothetical protein
MIRTMRARGSNPIEYDLPGTAETIPVKPTHTGSALGFRLAHDDSGRVIRDGSWRNDGEYIREGHYVMVDADYCSSALGFRLAREGT